RSEPQMPQLRTRTTTSPGPGSGRAISSTTTVPAWRHIAARIVAIVRLLARARRRSQRLPAGVMPCDDRSHAGRERFAILVAQSAGRNRLLDHDLDRAGDDRELAAARHQTTRPTAHDRDDRQPRADREHEASLLELA